MSNSRQAVTSLLAALREHLSSADAFHPRTKAVFLVTSAYMRLIRPLRQISFSSTGSEQLKRRTQSDRQFEMRSQESERSNRTAREAMRDLPPTGRYSNFGPFAGLQQIAGPN